MSQAAQKAERQRPKLAVLAVCVRQSKPSSEEDAELLLVQRRNPPDAGLWGFPGGHVEWGESLKTAALRELHEETGLHAKAGAVLDQIEMIDRDSAGQVRHHFLLLALACHDPVGILLAADDAAAAEWVGLSEILNGARPLSYGVDDLARKAIHSSRHAGNL